MRDKRILKSNKRYWFSLFFVAVMLGMCACGATEQNRMSIGIDEEVEEASDLPDAGESEEKSAEGLKTEEENEEESLTGDGGGESIEEQVLLEQDNIKITALEMVKDSIWGEGIKLLIENDSEKNIGVGCNALIVNDYMITDLFSTSVAAGKKANETMYMSSGQLEAAGINDIGQIEIYFHLYDSESYETLADPGGVVIRTSAYDGMDNQVEITGQELYSQGGIRIVGQYVDENSFWGMAVLLYIENNSGKKIGISCDDMSVNGYMVSPFFSSTIYDGKKSFDDITIFSSDLEENAIESVEDIELNFHIYDAETYDTIVDTGAISFHAN